MSISDDNSFHIEEKPTAFEYCLLLNVNELDNNYVDSQDNKQENESNQLENPQIKNYLSSDLLEEIDNISTCPNDDYEDLDQKEKNDKNNKEKKPLNNKFNLNGQQVKIFVPKSLNINLNPMNNLNNKFINLNANQKCTNKKNNKFVYREGDWRCSKCNNLNFAFRKVCNRCGIIKV